MKRTILLSLSLLALLFAPGMAAAEQTAPAPAVQGCNDLSFLSALNAAPAAPITTAASAIPAIPANLDPLAGAVEAQSGCCAGKLRACQVNCPCGAFEFNCDPATCQSSCICNIC